MIEPRDVEVKTDCRFATAVAAVLSAAVMLVPAPGVAQLTNGEISEERDVTPDEEHAGHLTVFDREGNFVRTIGERNLYSQPVFSPDRTRVAAIKADTSNLWVLDVTTGNGTQITFSQAEEQVSAPVWSPDGRQVAYVVRRGVDLDLYRQPSNGEGDEELLYQNPQNPKVVLGMTLTDWSLDGRFLSFYSGDLWGGTLYLFPLDGDGQPIEVLREESRIVDARLSPDNRYLAYRSDETGRNEIFVHSVVLPDDAANDSIEKWQVSTDGAMGMASWRQDGQELVYLGADRGVMAVEVNTEGTFESGQPRRLFNAPDAIPVTNRHELHAQSVSRDGQRVVFAMPPPQQLYQIAMLDREGNILKQIGEPGPYSGPRLSPDGSRLAVTTNDLTTGLGILMFDVSSGEGKPFALDPANEWGAIWSRDGNRVAYLLEETYAPTGDSNQGKYARILIKDWDGEGRGELLFRHTPGAEMGFADYSADGRFLSINSGGILLVVPLTGDDPLAREGVDFVREEFAAGGGKFSPDSRFLAYRSNESGQWEIYVRPVDLSTGAATDEGKWQVTHEDAGRDVSDIGYIVGWRQDGRELFYETRDPESMELRVMTVDVTATPNFQAGTPRLLFQLPGRPHEFGGMTAQPDGQTFVYAMPVETETPVP